MSDQQDTPTPEGDENSTTITDQEQRIAFGRLLSDCRAERECTIEQVALSTRISKEFLIALEHGDFEALPGKVFGRGFVKNICRFLKVDAQPYLDAYEAAWASDNQMETQNTDRMGALMQAHQPKVRLRTEEFFSEGRRALWAKQAAQLIGYPWPSSQLRKVRAGGLIGLSVLAAIFLISQIKYRTAEKVSPVAESKAPSEDITQAAAPSEPLAETPTDLSESESISQKPLQAPTSPSTTGEMLEVKVRSPVKVRFNIDRKGWQTTNLTPETYRYPFDSRMDLLIFDAASVDLNFNGRKVGPLGSKGRVRRLSFVGKDDTKAM